ncbi:MAG: iron-containing alcohol dehydrogenase [Spirochaetales bacterium]|nr:iron-containing alcohol dehydrogenase [Spirochaetales bacterium]
MKSSLMPALVVQQGGLVELPNLYNLDGKKILLVIGDRSFEKWDRFDFFIKKIMSVAGSVSIERVGREPECEDVDSIALNRLYRDIDLVIGIGGGSVIDVAKAVSAMLIEQQEIVNFLEGIGSAVPSGRRLPLIAVPTTSGTGSEATANSVIKGVKDGEAFKRSLRHVNYIPDFVLIDSELLVRAPLAVTINSGLDAISQLVEAFTSTKANPTTDALALKGLSLVGEGFELCITNPESHCAREKMALAAFYSGYALANAGLGIVHGVAGHLGGIFPIPHGAACGILLYPVFREILQELAEPGLVEKFAQIGEAFAGRRIESRQEAVDCFLEYIKKVSGYLTLSRISDYCAVELDFEKISKGFSEKNSPVSLSQDCLSRIIHEIW